MGLKRKKEKRKLLIRLYRKAYIQYKFSIQQLDSH